MFILYITTCIPSGKIYVGIHEQDDPWSFDGYLGSGKTLAKAIKKYGKGAFTRETLFYFYNEEDACIKEAEIVNEEFIEGRDWNYNIVLGGGKPPKSTTASGKKAYQTILKKNGGLNPAQMPGIGAKISITQLGNDKGKYQKLETREWRRKKMLLLNTFDNPSKTPTAKAKIGAARSNTKWINNGTMMKQLIKDQSLPDGWTFGMIKRKA